MYFTNPWVAAGTTNSQTHLGMFVVTPPILWCAAMYSSAHRVLLVSETVSMLPGSRVDRAAAAASRTLEDDVRTWNLERTKVC
jgi:hypothetical protein